jgi:hypothetical protein
MDQVHVTRFCARVRASARTCKYPGNQLTTAHWENRHEYGSYRRLYEGPRQSRSFDELPAGTPDASCDFRDSSPLYATSSGRAMRGIVPRREAIVVSPSFLIEI